MTFVLSTPAIRKIYFSRCAFSALLAITLLCSAKLPIARADAPTSQSAAAVQLQDQMKTAYLTVSAGSVQFQVPSTQPVDDTLLKYPELTPDVRRAIEQQLQQKGPASWNSAILPGGATQPVESPFNYASQPGLIPSTQAQPSFLNELAVLIDDNGNLLVPRFIDKSAIPPQGIKVRAGGEQVIADFVASDKPSEVTVLKLRNVPANMKPLVLANPLQEGDVALLVPPTGAHATPIVWTGETHDQGVIANIDGAIAGFSRWNQFFSAQLSLNVAHELIDKGEIRRPKIGVTIAVIKADDPLRQLDLIAKRPAVRVVQIAPDSLADQSGIQTNDVILKFDDQPVGDPPTFASMLVNRVGEVNIQLIRDGKILDLKAQFPDPWEK